MYNSSPVTTGIFISFFAAAKAFIFSANTGSSYQNGSNCSISRAIRTACIGASLRCISIRISMSGPTASRTACTFFTVCFSIVLSTKVLHGPGTGSNFNAVNPKSTILRACSATSFSSQLPPPQPLAYTLTLSLQGPPRSICTGKSQDLPSMSHIACSNPLTALYRSIAPRRAPKSSKDICRKCLICLGSRPIKYRFNWSM